MTSPKRVQLRRTKGWRKPPGAVVVARPGEWGNPYRVDRHRGDGLLWLTYSLGTDDVAELRTVASLEEGRTLAVEHYRRALTDGELPYRERYIREQLSGCDLACWCPLDEPCHADVLLAVANGATP